MNRQDVLLAIIPLTVCATSISTFFLWRKAKKYFGDRILQDSVTVFAANTARHNHDHRRQLTYPQPICNSWYHLCDSDEVKVNSVLEIRALGQTFAVWRKQDGTPVCQNAFCLHLGANLAVGGKVVDDCLQCPFHNWKFSSNGSISEIPYIKEPKNCPSKRLQTFTCQDYCGLLCVYFHADGEEPAFDLPAFVPSEFSVDGWVPHLKWDIGFKKLSPVDWVDQAGDHSHFHTLHADFLFPWTTIPIPKWIFSLFPMGIAHNLVTYRGDDKDWAERVQKTGQGLVDKHFIFFTDLAGLTWKGKAIETTLSETLETYCGPAMMIFHIPFTIGTFKVFVTTTPVENGSIMRARTWIDGRTKASMLKRFIAWILTGIASSQLASDIIIMENKIRLSKPLTQPFDGPYNRTNAWLKQFYSASSDSVGSNAYGNDW